MLKRRICLASSLLSLFWSYGYKFAIRLGFSLIGVDQNELTQLDKINKRVKFVICINPFNLIITSWVRASPAGVLF